jgi:hypothetical protein
MSVRQSARRLSRIASALALFVASLAAAPAAAQPAAVIYACVQSANGNVRFVPATEVCKKGETRIQWDATGAQGPQGPAGPAGPRGLTGATGAPGAPSPAGGIIGQLTSCPGDTATLAGIFVHVPGRNYNVVTGADGRFQFDLMPAGVYDVSVERAGAVLANVTGVTVGTTANVLNDILLSDSGHGCAPPPPPPACTFLLSPAVVNLSSAAAIDQTINVSTQSPCVWTATTNDEWVTVMSGGGSGPGVTVFSVAANTAGAARSATLTIGGQPAIVNQMGATCPLTVQALDPGAIATVAGDVVTMAAAGGSFQIAIASGCPDLPWTATADASWLAIAPGGGTGSSTITVTVDALSHIGAPRTANVNINGVVVTVKQIH